MRPLRLALLLATGASLADCAPPPPRLAARLDALETFHDVELVRTALPATLLELEADQSSAHGALCRGWATLALAVLEDDWEERRLAGNGSEEEEQRVRSAWARAAFHCERARSDDEGLGPWRALVDARLAGRVTPRNPPSARQAWLAAFAGAPLDSAALGAAPLLALARAEQACARGERPVQQLQAVLSGADPAPAERLWVVVARRRAGRRLAQGGCWAASLR